MMRQEYLFKLSSCYSEVLFNRAVLLELTNFAHFNKISAINNVIKLPGYKQTEL